MIENKTSPNDIDEYIACFPIDIRVILRQLRTAISNAAPDATEKISYQMPTFYFYGNLVHFAAYKNHIGFYPAASGIAAFSKEIETYKNSKGAVQFPIDKPLPLDLIVKIVKFRIAENLERARAKKQKNKDN